MKTLVMTNAEVDPLWQDWSAAVAYAESLPVGSDEEQAAWVRADELWERWLMAQHLNADSQRLCPKCRRPLIWCTCDELAELDDYAATVDAASYRGQ